MRLFQQLIPVLFVFLAITACNASDDDFHSADPSLNYLENFEPFYDSKLVNMVIEIPAGTNQKWEVNKQTGRLEWEQVGDSLRTINYLPYPANYGMIPGTYLPKELGGDDDPLDIFLLGPSLERGTVHPAKVIGVIKMLDRGEQDDKLVAVDPQSWFGYINSIEELNESFPGVTTILVTWLESYKGKDIVKFQRLGTVEEAQTVLNQAVENYK
jgi:inorganic pyrophosphatase